MSELVIEDCEFWFVWTKTGRPPRFAHQTQEAAEAEADRLARLQPHGKKYIVLRGYRKCHVPNPAPDQLLHAAPASLHSEAVSA